MRKLSAVTAAAGLVLLTSSMAMGGDKTQATFVAPTACTDATCPGIVPSGQGVSTAFVNGTSKGKTKTDAKCKGQIKFSKLNLAEGSTIICVTQSLATVSGNVLNAGSAVKLPVSKGKAKAKIDFASAGCVPDKGGSQIATYGGRTCCYEDDPAYTAATSCANNIPLTVDGGTGWVCAAAQPALPNSNVIACEGIFFR